MHTYFDLMCSCATCREQVEILTQVSLSPPQPQSDALVAAPYGGIAGGIASSELQVRHTSPQFSLPSQPHRCP